MEEDITIKLTKMITASCTCVTKTNDITFHNENCHYRVICEAITEIENLRKERIN